MKISEAGLSLIQEFEGFRDKAYQDSAGIWTIGFGTTHYPNGNAVKENDTCTAVEATEYLLSDVQGAVNSINHLTWNKPLNHAQFDSVVSFAYNLGINALKNSTLYKKASVNPDDETIYRYDPENPAKTCEFTKWVNAGGKQVKGLLIRRMKEADYYNQK